MLVDEEAGASGRAVARGDMDAPEVDMLALIEDSAAAVGDRIAVRVEAVDEEFNLICRALPQEV